jgi:hypothetical protein
MKKKYYGIGITVFIALLVGYHFLAASQAESQIDEALQEQSEQNPGFSVQYSTVEVAPFAATIVLRNLTVVLGDHIERAQKLRLDMSYFDFLNVYFGGLPYGLENLTAADVLFVKPTYVNQSGLQEIKADSLQLQYSGNAMDGLQSAVNGTSFAHAHSIQANSSGLIISVPQSTINKVTAGEFRYSGTVEAQTPNFWLNGNHQFGMDSLNWTPSESFQKSYSFFIKGFGYPTNAIPFRSAQLHVKPTTNVERLRIESTVRSELALLSGSGHIALRQPFGTSRLEDTKLSLTQLSDSLKNVIGNIERLFSISLPTSNEGISLQLNGTLSNPTIAN